MELLCLLCKPFVVGVLYLIELCLIDIVALLVPLLIEFLKLFVETVKVFLSLTGCQLGKLGFRKSVSTFHLNLAVLMDGVYGIVQ